MDQHAHHGQVLESVACAVVTVSDTRTPETDRSGTWLRERLAVAGHPIVNYRIIRDEPREIREHMLALCESNACTAILITGGTGLTSRDNTYEAVSQLLEKSLDGFGELFRMLSFAEIGAAAMLSRAVAGIRGRSAVFLMPGSPAAVQLAFDRLILPQLGHVAWLLAH